MAKLCAKPIVRFVGPTSSYDESIVKQSSKEIRVCLLLLFHAAVGEFVYVWHVQRENGPRATVSMTREQGLPKMIMFLFPIIFLGGLFSIEISYKHNDVRINVGQSNIPQTADCRNLLERLLILVEDVPEKV